MKCTIHMELIILILAFGLLSYAVYNTVTWCSHGAVVSLQMFLQLLCRKLDFFIVHSPTFITVYTPRSKIKIHSLCIIALLGFVLNSVEWVFFLLLADCVFESCLFDYLTIHVTECLELTTLGFDQMMKWQQRTVRSTGKAQTPLELRLNFTLVKSKV